MFSSFSFSQQRVLGSGTCGRFFTHIVLEQVRMVPLYPVVQDGHNHAFTCVAQLPRSFGIQVTVVVVVLGAGKKQIAQKESN